MALLPHCALTRVLPTAHLPLLPQVLAPGVVPNTRHVRGTNFNMVNVFPDRMPGRAIVISVIDNLVKGASGQAMQNLNLMLGYEETTALMQLAMFP
jgi:N-acetyl-gamma-glutamyl-phosphate reductase